jgi:hypothetical protein
MPAKKISRRPANQQPDNNDPDTDLEEETLETDESDADGSEDVNADQDQGAGDNESQDGSQGADEAPERMMGAPRDGRTYRAGEDIVFKGEKRGGVIVSTENIYRGVKAPGSDRYRFHQVLARGVEVPGAKCTEISEGEYKATTQL